MVCILSAIKEFRRHGCRHDLCGQGHHRDSKKYGKAGLAILGTFVIFFLFNFIIARILISKTSSAIGDIVGGLHKLENGELNFYIKDSTFRRSDELGVIAESSAQVRDKLQDVISVAKKLSVNVTESGVSLANSAGS